jgi:energy-coupling factor transport system ATP-binding protein
MSEALKLEHVKFGYSREHNIFKDLNLVINEGEYVVLLGHNGSGKSTLAKIIIGLNDIKKGKITVFGTELSDKNLYSVRKNIGIIFQNPDNQFIGSTVKDDIAFGLENACVPHNEMQKIIEEYASKVGMSEFLDKEPSNLSGGQKQRVAIAGTLATHPRLLIMDESTSMLDPKGKKEIRELTQNLRNEDRSLTIISITHDIEEALQADRVIVLEKGQIVLNGTPKEVFSHPEIMKQAKLDIPFVYKLNEELNNRGVKVKSLDFEGLVNELCQ